VSEATSEAVSGAMSDAAGYPAREVVLAAKNLTKIYHVHRPAWGGAARCARSTTSPLEVRAGETLGIVGESGCGKSTLAVPGCGSPTSPRHRDLRRRDISRLSRHQLRPVRKELQLVFQDPYARSTRAAASATSSASPWRFKATATGAPAHRVKTCCTWWAWTPVMRTASPTSFSGGSASASNRRALAMEPKVIVADEPVSALDVSIQAQVLNLFPDLQTQLDLTYVFIAHDLGVVRHVSTRIAVMYSADHGAGRLEKLYAQAGPSLHPGPALGGTRGRRRRTEGATGMTPRRERILLTGDVPDRWTGRRAARSALAAPTPSSCARPSGPALRRWHPAARAACTSPCSPRGRSLGMPVRPARVQAPGQRHIGFLSFGHWSTRRGRRLGRRPTRCCSRSTSRSRPKTLEPTGAYFRVHHFAASSPPVPAAGGDRREDQPRRDRHRVIDMRYENPLYLVEDAGAPTSSGREGSSSASAGITRAGHRRLAVLRLPSRQKA